MPRTVVEAFKLNLTSEVEQNGPAVHSDSRSCDCLSARMIRGVVIFCVGGRVSTPHGRPCMHHQPPCWAIGGATIICGNRTCHRSLSKF
mmetsp:Transcript_72999/g.128627  ORF Transcript_72999/g.128627 Transcript_72999/m.128627 type:complete len:89 (-) Transcript_72999:607-873(-)